MKRRGEEGQAIAMVVLAMGLLLVGAMGLAVDGSQMYAHRQMAQSAADAAAESGIMSIFDKTNTGGNAFGSAAFNCTSGTDVRTPCRYARLNGFGLVNTDTVAVDFPGSGAAPGVTLSASAPVNLIRVTVTRTLPTGFMRLLGSSTSTIKALAIAAIVDVVAPTPIIVTHPTLSGSFSVGGNTLIQICGGPARSIQVNSISTSSVSAGGSSTVDLSHAGPLDTAGDCTAGTGADFGDFGGPGTYPDTLLLGTKPGRYVQPASPIPDPLASVPAPAIPTTIQTAPTPLANGVNGCPASPPKPCNLYHPGLWAKIEVKNETGVFAPGLYYINGGGFKNAANGNMLMSTGLADDPVTAQGMVVYNTGSGTFDVGSNSAADLTGAPMASIYKGLLFFEDRNAPAHTGSGGHTLGGGGDITLRGTIYLNNTTMTSSVYQNLRLRGNAGNFTKIIGQIIVSTLDMGGGGTIVMNLSPLPSYVIQQVALVK